MIIILDMLLSLAIIMRETCNLYTAPHKSVNFKSQYVAGMGLEAGWLGSRPPTKKLDFLFGWTNLYYGKTIKGCSNSDFIF
jgi:hypothetical protein